MKKEVEIIRVLQPQSKELEARRGKERNPP